MCFFGIICALYHVYLYIYLTWARNHHLGMFRLALITILPLAVCQPPPFGYDNWDGWQQATLMHVQ